MVLAIDPGSAKCGVAVVCSACLVHERTVIGTQDLVETVQMLCAHYRPERILIGGGTGSRPIVRCLEAALLPAPVLVVDEGYTSEAARARYLLENPPRGWERLLPRSLRTPSVPYDDYVAVILAERFWADERRRSASSSEDTL